MNIRSNLIKLTRNYFNYHLKSRQISYLSAVSSNIFAQKKIKSKKEKQIFYSYLSTSSQKSSSTESEQSELIVQHLSDGIVELQLNRSLGKNALSKKLLFEVRSNDFD